MRYHHDWIHARMRWNTWLSMVYKPTQESRVGFRLEIVVSGKHSSSCSAQGSQQLVVPPTGHSRLQFAQLSINWQSSRFIWLKLLRLRRSIVSSSGHSKIAEDMPAKGLSIPKPNVSSASSERPMESEEWKRRPPYLIQSPEEFGPVKWQAKCQCGQVTYKISREKPLKAKYCHCRGCQVMHGESGDTDSPCYVQNIGRH